MILGPTGNAAGADGPDSDLALVDVRHDPLATGTSSSRLAPTTACSDGASNGHAAAGSRSAEPDFAFHLASVRGAGRDGAGRATARSRRGAHTLDETLVFRDEETVLTLFRRLRAVSATGRVWQPGQDDADTVRHQLVVLHTPLVEHCARNLAGAGEPVEDLVQEGFVGLIKAVDRFDPDQGVRFSTYAYHLISGEIRHYLRDLGKLIREPGWHSELRQRILRANDQLVQKLGRAPAPAEIAEVLHLSVDAVAEVLKRQHALVVESLDSALEADGAEDSPGGWSAGLNLTHSAWEAHLDDRLMLDAALPRLRALERKAVTWFYFHDLTKTEIARRLDISINYAAYLVKRGLKNLRQIMEQGDTRPARVWNYDKVPREFHRNLAGYPTFRGWLSEDVQRASHYQKYLNVVRIVGGRERPSRVVLDTVPPPETLFRSPARWSQGIQTATEISRRPHPSWPGVHLYGMCSDTDRKGKRAVEKWLQECQGQLGLLPGPLAADGPEHVTFLALVAR